MPVWPCAGAYAVGPMRSGTLETRRLRLDRWAAAHTELLVRLSSVPEVMRFIGSGAPWSPARAQDVAVAQRRHWSEHGFGWRAASEKATGDLVGFIALNFAGTGTVGLAADEYEVGWWLFPHAWGRGLAREGALAVRDDAFDALKAPSIVARVQPTNARSIAVVEAVGLTPDFSTTGTFGESVLVYRLAAVNLRASANDEPQRLSPESPRNLGRLTTAFRVAAWAGRWPSTCGELVVDSLEMAIRRRRPTPGWCTNSDRGGQYVSLIFGQTARAAGIAVSMGAKGCALDNAVCEAFFATLKKELTRRRSWSTRLDLETAVFAWIEGWYNRRRLHSTLGYVASETYENGTLSRDGTGLAASRLAPSPIMIKDKAA